jgi:regulator of sigma E protease
LFFIAVEAIFGRRVVPTFERYAHMVGMVILIALIILITFRDIARIFAGVPLVP